MADTQVSLESCVRPAEGVLVTLAGDEAVLLDANSNHYFGLNGSGTRMWTAATSEPSLAFALERLEQAYPGRGEELRRDLLKLVADLVARGLLVVQPG